LEREVGAAEGGNGVVTRLILGKVLECLDDRGEGRVLFFLGVSLGLGGTLADANRNKDFRGPFVGVGHNALQGYLERGGELLGGNGFLRSGAGEDRGELRFQGRAELVTGLADGCVFDALGYEGGVDSVGDGELSDDVFHIGIGIGIGIGIELTPLHFP